MIDSLSTLGASVVGIGMMLWVGYALAALAVGAFKDFLARKDRQ